MYQKIFNIVALVMILVLAFMLNEVVQNQQEFNENVYEVFSSQTPINQELHDRLRIIEDSLEGSPYEVATEENTE